MKRKLMIGFGLAIFSGALLLFIARNEKGSLPTEKILEEPQSAEETFKKIDHTYIDFDHKVSEDLETQELPEEQVYEEGAGNEKNIEKHVFISN